MSYDFCKREYQVFLNTLNEIRPLLWQSKYSLLNKKLDTHYRKWQSSNYDDYEESYENFIKICNYDVFKNDSSLEEVYKKLIQWWNEAPSCYCAIMLGQYWKDLAVRERGTVWAKHVSPSAWSNAEIAKDTAFFWYISALHLEPKLPSVYTDLLILSAFLEIPFWLWKPEKTVNFHEHYNKESIDFYKNKYHITPQLIHLPQHMPVPSEAEFEYPPLYWFNRAIEISPQYLYIFRNYVHYLAPRWYGHEYEDIDKFLQYNVCQSLPEELYNSLVVKKNLDFLSSDMLEANIDFSNLEKVEYYTNQYDELLKLKLLDIHKFELYYNLMFFYGNRIKKSVSPSDRQSAENYIKKMFSIADIILENYSLHLLKDNRIHGEFIEKLKWCINKENTNYQDESNTLQRAIKLLNIPQEPASLVSILLHSYKEINDPILSVENTNSFEDIIKSPDSNTFYGIDNGVDLIFQDHHYEAGLLLLENLSHAGHDQSSYILYNLYNGDNYYKLNKNPALKNSSLSAKWLDIAINQKNKNALLEWALKESDNIKNYLNLIKKSTIRLKKHYLT